MLTKEISAPKKKLKDFVQPQPTKSESRFEIDELFFSITDLQSTITFANDTFIRISKYEPNEIIGQLHKIVRHPDMPRAVFEVFWDFLKAGKPVAAYVKNMAKDGSFYWVIALAVPTKNGYQSIRLKPTSPIFDKIQAIYKKILAFEKEQEKLTDKKTALKNSVNFLVDQLKVEGYENYDHFMWTALQTEMEHRESKLPHFNNRLKRYKEKNINSDLINVAYILETLFTSLNDLDNIQKGLIEHSDYIINLSKSIVLLALNAQVSSAKMSDSGSSLSVIAEKMGEQSVFGEKQLVAIKNSINNLQHLSSNISFNIMYTKLQVEMTLDFLIESENDSNSVTNSTLTSKEVIHLLMEAFKPQLVKIAADSKDIPSFLNIIMNGIKEIERFMMVLRFIHITGKVEISRIVNQNDSFSTTFHDLISEIQTAEQHLKSLTNIVLENQGLTEVYTKLAASLSTSINRI